MKILVTGCNGFIGSEVVSNALKKGHQVAGIARSATPYIALDHYYSSDMSVSTLVTTIEEFRPEAIIHAAGAASVAASFAAPLEDMQGGVRPWSHLLEAARISRQAPHIIYLSSAAVYGNASSAPLQECRPEAPISPYGYHKVLCEMLAQEYAACFSLKVSIARLFSVFGPRQRRLLVWDIFRKASSDQCDFQFDGTGDEMRDFLSSSDVALGLLKLAAYGNTGRLMTVNLARGEATSVKRMAEMVAQHVGNSQQPSFSGKVRVGDPGVLAADISNLRQCLPGWQPDPLDFSIGACVQYWMTNQSSTQSV